MIRVLVVDDSAVTRLFLRKLFLAQGDMEVETAPDAYVARDRFKRFQPHVLTLDIEMPGMDGLSFLEKLMAYKPTPVVVLSSYVGPGAVASQRALALGAFDVVRKPGADRRASLEIIGPEIVRAVRAAAASNPNSLSPRRLARPRPAPRLRRRGAVSLFCVGASTGGTVALGYVLRNLPRDLPPIALVQHMPPTFVPSFVQTLDRDSPLEVVLAEDGLPLRPGQVVVAPGDLHLVVRRAPTGRLVAGLDDGPPRGHHRPSVDVLFSSAARVVGSLAAGVLLTGMGEDGAEGLLELKRAGAPTIAQDQATSVVFGMPRAAIERGAAGAVLALDEIPDALVQLARGDGGRSS